MEIHLKIIGGCLIVLALLHVVFPKYFKWKQEFQTLSLINKQMMYVHTFFIAFTVFLMGILCLFHAAELHQTVLGKNICFGFFVFWFFRLIVQFFGYSPQLWKGKIFETIIHISFSLLWLYLSVIFFLSWYC